MVDQFVRCKKVDGLQKQLESSKRRDMLVEWIKELCKAALVVYVLVHVVCGLYVVKDQDMSPLIQSRDFIVYNKWNKDLKYGDVVVYVVNNQQHIGRVVGKNQDTLDLKDRMVYRNKQRVIEDYCNGETVLYDEGIEFPLTLNEDEYFVLADHRSCAFDSRSYGPLKKEQVLGVVCGSIRTKF